MQPEEVWNAGAGSESHEPTVGWSRQKPVETLSSQFTSEVVMHTLMVLYPEPADPEHFRDYYLNTHLPLVTRMPGLLDWRYSFEVAATQGPSPYFAIFEADFADAAAMTAARESPVGRQVAADVVNYSGGGAVVIHYPVQNAICAAKSVPASYEEEEA